MGMAQNTMFISQVWRPLGYPGTPTGALFDETISFIINDKMDTNDGIFVVDVNICGQHFP